MTELERRDTPAWWTVAAPVPAGGTVGSTDASHVGDLSLNPEYPAANGVATVWADTAAEAATKAIRGTVTVTLLGQSVEYPFGPDTVGAAVADHKAFLAVAAGSGVTLGFEDMAGQPGCDYDYNDRTWGGVTVSPTSPPVIAQHDEYWGPAGITDYPTRVHIHQKVIQVTETEYEWREEFSNPSTDDNSDYSFYSLGVGVMEAGVPNLADITRLETPSGWSASMLDPSPSMNRRAIRWEGGPLMPGEAVAFKYFTPARPVSYSSGIAETPPTPDGNGEGTDGCSVLAPGEADADITIDGDLTVGAANPEVPGSKGVVTEFSPKNDTNEDTIGGLVVMNSNGNNAPRQQITIQKLQHGVGFPAVGGQVTLTVPGQVKLFDAATQGNSVATGTVFNQNALPKKLWVEGVAYSGAMQDVKIKATPVGNAAGADDVSFTVLWVDVVVATDGKVSANNDKLPLKKSVTFDAAGNNTDALGISTIVVPGETRISYSLEGRGLVHPADFSYPGSDLRLRRDCVRKAYLTPPGGAVEEDNFGNIEFTDDTSLPEWRDDNPLDSCGYIYDIDFPGFVISDSNTAQGTVLRYRMNFKQTAAITINGTNTRASGTYCYYVRISYVQTGPGVTDKWTVITPADILGDNKAFGPDQTKLSADLK